MEGDVFEFHIPAELLPVVLLRMEGVAVHGFHFRRVLHIGSGLQQFRGPFDTGLQRDEGGRCLYDMLDGFHDAQSVGHENGQGADLHHALNGEVSALPQYQCQRDGGQGGDGGGKQSGPFGGAHRHVVHGGGVPVKVPSHDLFHRQRPDGTGTGDAFIEVSGDEGVLLPDSPVPYDELSLEQGDEDQRNRHQKKQSQRQFHVDEEHDHKDEEDVGSVPHEIHDAPGERRGDLVRVAHEPGMDVSHVVGIVIGEGQGLQVMEHRIFHVPSDIQFDLADEITGDHVADDLQEQYQKVQQDKRRQRVQGSQRDIVIDGIAVKQGIDGVRHTGEGSQ